MVDTAILSFVEKIAQKYNLDSLELLDEWNKNMHTSSKITKKTSVVEIPSKNDHMDSDDLLKYKKPELQALCRQKGVKCSGTKSQLVGYLLGKEPVLSGKKVASSKKKVPPKKNTPVAKKLISQVASVAIRRNQYDNHEHPETSLVFDKKTGMVIGKQNDSGSVDELTTDDIEVCKQMKFKYTMPGNLDKDELGEVNIEELEGGEGEEEKDEGDEDILEEELIELDEEEEEEEEFIEEEGGKFVEEEEEE